MRSRYDNVRVIGEGSFCQVSEVSDTSGKRYALKELLPRHFHFGGTETVSRFRREIRLLMGPLKSKEGIVRLIDCSLDSKHPYFVMPIAAKSLEQALKESSLQLPEDIAAAWFLQITAGVGHVHANGIVHRDLKPSNILLFPIEENRNNSSMNVHGKKKEQEFKAVVSDFGIGALSLGGATATSGALGTLRYTSPEVLDVFRRNGRVSAAMWVASDIFALGMILYEMLAPPAARDGHLNLDAVPDAYRKLIAGMCGADTEERIQSVGDVRVRFLDAWSKRANVQPLLEQALKVVTGGDRRMLNASFSVDAMISLLVVRLSHQISDKEGLVDTVGLIKKSIFEILKLEQAVLMPLLSELMAAANRTVDPVVKKDIVEILVDLARGMASGVAHSACWKFVADSAVSESKQMASVAQFEFALFCLGAETREADLKVVELVLRENSKSSEYWRTHLRSMNSMAWLPDSIRDILRQ